MTHWLLDPAVTPENGEVSALEASSIALCTELSCGAAAFGETVLGGLAAGAAGAPPSISCWWADALLVWLTANSANDAIAIRQMTRDARRSRPASEESTSLD